MKTLRHARLWFLYFCMGAVLAALVGCGAPPTAYRVGIDPRFTTEEQAELVAAVDQWRSAVGPSLRLDVSVWSCNRGDGDALVCISPTTLALNAQRVPDISHPGGFTHGPDLSGSSDVYIATDDTRTRELIVSVVAHELGHAMDLAHTGEGTIMCASTACQPPAVTCKDAQQWAAVRAGSLECL